MADYSTVVCANCKQTYNSHIPMQQQSRVTILACPPQQFKAPPTANG